MSKIGRKMIPLAGVTVSLNGQTISYKGSRASGEYTLPAGLGFELKGDQLYIVTVEPAARDINRIWGLNRALLANAIKGASVGFEKKLEIVGLGYKAAVSGDKVTFSLGYSHKKEFVLPTGVTLTVDKNGQILTFASADKELLGGVCGRVKELRRTEPYKGTGIKGVGEIIARKAGKTKSS